MAAKGLSLIVGILVLFAVTRPIVFAQSTITVTPPGGSTNQGLVSQIAYVHGGTIGVALALDPQDNVLLFTFSMQNGNVLDQADLTPILGPEVVARGTRSDDLYNKLAHGSGLADMLSSRRASKPIADANRLENPSFDFLVNLASVQTFDSLGLIAVSGEDAIGVPSRTQHVIMFSSDTQGNLSKLWDQSYASTGGAPGPTYPVVAFNSGGSGLYVLTYSAPVGAPVATSTVSLLNVADGTTAASLQLPNSDSLAVGLADDTQNKRLVVLVNPFLYTITEQSNNVAIAGTFKVSVPSVSTSLVSTLLGIAGGQFAITYGWTGLPLPLSGNSIFFSTDLDSGKTISGVVGDKGGFPFANNIVFDPVGGNVLVPYSIMIVPVSSVEFFEFFGSSRLSIAPVASSGRLMKAVQTELPLDSNGTDLIAGSTNAIASSTGAMVFVATLDGTMFTLDAKTGAVINSIALDPSNLDWISLDSATNQLVFNNGTVLGVIPAPDQPSISAVTVADHRLTIEGFNFLSGGTVTLNGQIVAARPGSRPGREIVIDGEKAVFARGQPLSVVVTNPDKLASVPFTTQAAH
ncbi:MAG TPA: hypothetical protein VI756_05795 [Blastocatellia bacterium]